MRIAVADIEAAGLAVVGGVVTIPHPAPVPDGPTTLDVAVEMDGDHVRLWPERSYRHGDLVRALGR